MKLQFDETDEIGWFQKQNYKVSCKVLLKRRTTIVVTTVVDSSAGPNVIRAGFPPPEWQKAEKRSVRPPRPEPAFGKALQMNGVVSLYVKKRVNIATDWFGLIDGLAVNTFLGISYVDRWFRYFLSMERQIFLIHTNLSLLSPWWVTTNTPSVLLLWQ